MTKHNQQPIKAPIAPAPPPARFSPRLITIIVLGCILVFVIMARARILDVPLERDEGEYAYIGKLILQGHAPYSTAYSMKLPGTALMYAAIMSIFGESVRGIHLGLLLVNCLTIVLVYVTARKLMSDAGAVVSAAAYAMLSLSSSVFGFAAHATHFVALPVLAGALLLLSAAEKGVSSRYFFSGIAFGLAFIMKQPGLFFVAFGIAYVLYNQFFLKPEKSKRSDLVQPTLFILGSLLPFLAVLLWISAADSVRQFWFWTFQYAAQYAGQVPLSDIPSAFGDGLGTAAGSFFPVWILSAFGFGILLLDRKRRALSSFLLLFGVFSLLSVFPGFYFREHYFVTLLPAVSMATAVCVLYLNEKAGSFLRSPWARHSGTALFIAALLFGVAGQKEYFFHEAPSHISRRFYAYNPFPESIEIARFIKANSSDTDRIAVLGSEPQIYFYSGRRSVTGHIYMYGMMEKHDYALAMQQEMIHDIESGKPKFIVLVGVEGSWLIQPYSDTSILKWMYPYLKEHYQLVGAVDMIGEDKTVYVWGSDAASYRFQSPDKVLVFLRNGDKLAE